MLHECPAFLLPDFLGGTRSVSSEVVHQRRERRTHQPALFLRLGQRRAPRRVLQDLGRIERHKGEYTISEEPLDGMMYVYQFIVTDIFGVTHYSDAAILKMTYTCDELKEHPLPDGQYAATIEEVFQTNGASVVD